MYEQEIGHRASAQGEPITSKDRGAKRTSKSQKPAFWTENRGRLMKVSVTCAGAGWDMEISECLEQWSERGAMGCRR